MELSVNQTRRDPLWDRLVFLPAQLSRLPLFSPAEAHTNVTVGKSAMVPMELGLPLIVSHMSYGALSAELKYALARAAAAANTANGSGEGGVLPEEIELSSAYIYEYTPGLYSLSPEVLERCSAVEIKLGRSLSGGLGETLSEGLPTEVYHMRGTEPGAFFSSPGRFAEINSSYDLKITVDGLREGCGGKPVGLKLAAGDIEGDLAAALEAGVDFVTLDGGNNIGGSDVLAGSCVPTLHAICRARRFLEKEGAELDIIAAGGMRTNADFIKALALGATAVASASAVLNAAQAAPDGGLGLSPEETAFQLESFFRRFEADLARVCAFTGRLGPEELSHMDVGSLSTELSRATGIRNV